MLDDFDRSSPDPQAAAPLTAAAAPVLTPKQVAILALLAAGETHRGVAMAVGLSHHSIKNAVPVIVRKLGATNTTGAVVAAYHMGILDPSKIDVLGHDLWLIERTKHGQN